MGHSVSTAYSAWVCRPRPNTSSPTRTPSTPSPISSTTPAASKPSPTGSVSGFPPAIIPPSTLPSNALMLAATTLIRISPAPACGSLTSAIFSCSGPP